MVSPDGRHVYVASFGNHAIAIFAAPAHRPPHAAAGPARLRAPRAAARSCRRAPGARRPGRARAQPRRRERYVASAGSDALSVFARNRAHRGAPPARRRRRLLQPAGRRRLHVGPRAQRADERRRQPRRRRASTSRAAASRARSRSSTRAADGSLTQPAGPAGCVSHRGGSDCAPARALASPEEVAVTPDSRHVLVAGMRSNAVPCSRRARRPDPGRRHGRLHRARRRGRGLRVRARLAGPVDLAISRDGRYVYAASSISDGVAILAPRPGDRRPQPAARPRGLHQPGRRRRTLQRGRGLDEVWGVALSPDGRNLYAVSSKVNMLSAIARDTATGRLTQLPGRFGCFIRAGRALGCPEGRGLTSRSRSTVSPDGRNVYVASEDTYLGSVAIFRRLAR